MKKLSIYLFLILFGFSAQSYADDISDFEIGGISIGDSALKYYSEKKIKKRTENIYGDNLYTQFTSTSKNSNSEYDSHQIHYKLGDKNYIIESVAGVKWTESFDQCKKSKKKNQKRIINFFFN